MQSEQQAIPHSAAENAVEHCQQQRFDELVRRRCRELVSDALIAEFKGNIAGPHSDDLSRLLNYFRRGSVKDKYALYAYRHFEEYGIFRLSGDRHVPPQPVDDRRYRSQEEAEIAVFLLRVAELSREDGHGEVRS